VPNKANFCRFWAKNAGWAEERTQSKPIFGQQAPAGQSGRSRCHQARQTKPISRVFRPRTRVGRKNKANQSQFDGPESGVAKKLRIPRTSGPVRYTNTVKADISTPVNQWDWA